MWRIGYYVFFTGLFLFLAIDYLYQQRTLRASFFLLSYQAAEKLKRPGRGSPLADAIRTLAGRQLNPK